MQPFYCVKYIICSSFLIIKNIHKFFVDKSEINKMTKNKIQIPINPQSRDLDICVCYKIGTVLFYDFNLLIYYQHLLMLLIFFHYIEGQKVCLWMDCFMICLTPLIWVRFFPLLLMGLDQTHPPEHSCRFWCRGALSAWVLWYHYGFPPFVSFVVFHWLCFLSSPLVVIIMMLCCLSHRRGTSSLWVLEFK